jgi:hypothetical protein
MRNRKGDETMRILILAATLLLPGAASATPPPIAVKYTPPSGKACPPVSRFHAMKLGKSLKPQKLSELPPADHYKAAYRTVRGCEVPIIANFRQR